MGTDRTEYIREPCLCGSGEIVINHAAPDHPFARAGAFNWELWLECETCKNDYALISQDDWAVIVRRSDLIDHQQRKDAVYQRRKELEQSDRIQGYIHQFCENIANEDTEKRKFRYPPYCAAFARGGRIPKEMPVEEIVALYQPTLRLNDVASLLKAIALKDDDLLRELETIKTEEGALKEPYAVVGEPIVELTLKAFYRQ